MTLVCGDSVIPFAPMFEKSLNLYCAWCGNNVMFIHFVFVPSPVMIFQHYKRRTAGRCMAHMLHVQTHAHSTHHQQLHV